MGFMQSQSCQRFPVDVAITEQRGTSFRPRLSSKATSTKNISYARSFVKELTRILLMFNHMSQDCKIESLIVTMNHSATEERDIEARLDASVDRSGRDL